MLRNKGITKLDELKGIFTPPEKAGDTLLDIGERFFTPKLKGRFDVIKKKGYLPSDILLILLYLPFLGVSSVWGLFKSGCSTLSDAQKDVYYRLKNNPDINWRGLLYSFAKRFKRLSEQKGEAASDSPRCFIVDDSDCLKCGKRIEFIGKIFSHVLHTWKPGFKLLTLGYWDGKSLLPLDFSFHSEKGKNKSRPYGMKPGELKKRFSKQRGVGTPGAQRVKELSESKIKNAVKMIKRAVKHGFAAEYVLSDSWFTSEFFISSIRKIKKGMLHVLAMCKMDKRNYFFEGKEYTAKQLLQRFKGAKKRSRKVNAYYIELSVEYKGIPLKLFFSRYSRRGKWHLLITTDLTLKFNKAIEIYSIRWGIEVFFKEAKQYLNLGKSQANDFDAQVAEATIAMMQYIVLTLYKRFQAYETIGELFRESQRHLLELTVAERLWGLFIELQRQIAEVFEIDIEDLLEKMIAQPECEQKILKILQAIKHDDPGRPEPEGSHPEFIEGHSFNNAA